MPSLGPQGLPIGLGRPVGEALHVAGGAFHRDVVIIVRELTFSVRELSSTRRFIDGAGANEAGEKTFFLKSKLAAKWP